MIPRGLPTTGWFLATRLHHSSTKRKKNLANIMQTLRMAE